MPRVNVILVAGGSGRRFGGPVAKQFQLLAGDPLLVRSARAFTAVPGLTRMIVVAAADEHGRCERLLGPLALPLRLAAAGRERQDSVRAGVAVLDDDCDIAVVHDAVRPLVAPATIAACIAAAAASGAALVAVPVTDTVKRAAAGRVIETVPRHDLWLAQTPQAFHADVLRRAHAEAVRANLEVTDDTALVERLGLPVQIVAGDARNRKITTPDDLAWAEALLRAEDTGR